MREFLEVDQSSSQSVTPIRRPGPERVNFRRELGDLINLSPRTRRGLQRTIAGCYGLALGWAADEDVRDLWRLMIIADPPSGQISCLGLVPSRRDRQYALTAYQGDYRGQPDFWIAARIFFFDAGIMIKCHHRSSRSLSEKERKRIFADFQSLLGLGKKRQDRRFSLVFYVPDDDNRNGWEERRREVIAVRSLSAWLLEQSRAIEEKPIDTSPSSL